MNILIYYTALAPKKAQLIPCTVVFYDKYGTIQRAGCQLPRDRLRWLHLRAIVLGHATSPMRDNSLYSLLTLKAKSLKYQILTKNTQPNQCL